MSGWEQGVAQQAQSEQQARQQIMQRLDDSEQQEQRLRELLQQQQQQQQQQQLPPPPPPRSREEWLREHREAERRRHLQQQQLEGARQALHHRWQIRNCHNDSILQWYRACREQPDQSIPRPEFPAPGLPAFPREGAVLPLTPTQRQQHGFWRQSHYSEQLWEDFRRHQLQTGGPDQHTLLSEPRLSPAAAATITAAAFADVLQDTGAAPVAISVVQLQQCDSSTSSGHGEQGRPSYDPSYPGEMRWQQEEWDWAAGRVESPEHGNEFAQRNADWRQWDHQWPARSSSGWRRWYDAQDTTTWSPQMFRRYGLWMPGQETQGRRRPRDDGYEDLAARQRRRHRQSGRYV